MSDPDAFLVRPTVDYRESYLAAIREMQAEGRWPEVIYPAVKADFATFVADLRRRETRPAPGLVPDSDFWLVDGVDFIGRLSIRHYLNDFLKTFGGHIGYEIRPSKRRRGYGKLILKLGLVEARKMGLTRVLLTCDDTNIASARIIESNGGVFQDVNLLDWRDVPTRRYWIDIPPEDE